MDIKTARRILDVKPGATEAEVEKAKRRLVSAVHPDKNRASDGEVFEKLTRDIIEAADILQELSRLGVERPLSLPATASPHPFPLPGVKAVLIIALLIIIPVAAVLLVMVVAKLMCA